MNKGYNLLEKAVNTKDFTKIREYLGEAEAGLSRKYRSIFETEDFEKEFFKKAFDEIIESYYICPPGDIRLSSYYKKEIVSRIKRLVKGYSDEEIYRTIEKFIAKNIQLDDISDLNSYIKTLEKIDVFVVGLGILPSVDVIDRVLTNSKSVSELVDRYIKSSSDSGVIRYSKVFEVSAGIVTTMLLERYCVKNYIKIDKSAYEEDDDSKSNIKKVNDYSTLEAVSMYLKDITAIPMLSPLEEITLFQKYHAGDESAKTKIIEANLRLVVSVAKRYQGRNAELLDIIQYGNLGLYEAIERFDEYSGYKFSTYAVSWIRQNITRGLIDECTTIRVPVHISESVSKYKKVYSNFLNEYGREPDVFELAEILDWTTEKVLEIQSAIPNITSLNKLVGDDDDSEIGDYIPSSESVEENAIDNITRSALHDKIFEVFDAMKLPEKERKIILLRFGFIDDRIFTLEEIANDFGVTRERIRQIEAKVLRRLRVNSHGRELAYFLDDPEKGLENIKDRSKASTKAIGDFLDTSKKVKRKKIKSSSTRNVSGAVGQDAYDRREFGLVSEYGEGIRNVPVYYKSTPQSNVMSFSEKEKFLNGGKSSLGDKVEVRRRVVSKIRNVQDSKIDVNGSTENSSGAILNRPSNVNANVNVNANLHAEKLDDSVVKKLGIYVQDSDNSDDSDSNVDRVAGVTLNIGNNNIKNATNTHTSDLVEEVDAINDSRTPSVLVISDDVDSDSVSKMPVKAGTGSRGKKRITLYETYEKVDEQILEKIISQLRIDYQEIVKLYNSSAKLNQKQRNTYYGTIIPNVRKGIAREVFLGNLSESVLEEYSIMAYRETNRSTLFDTFSKVDKEILTGLISELSDYHKDVIKKYESGADLEESERKFYHLTVKPAIKRKIAREVYFGRVSKDVLDEYNIEPLNDASLIIKKATATIECKKYNLTLKEKFSKIDSSILDSIIADLPEDYRELTLRKGVSKLTKEENAVYLHSVLPMIKRKIARKVYFGRIPKEVLDEYSIKPFECQKSVCQTEQEESISSTGKGKSIKRTRKNNLTLKERFSKIDGEILDSIIADLPENYRELILRKGVSKLTKEENVVYLHSVLPMIKRKIAREVYFGRIPKEVLDEYSIKPFEGKIRVRQTKQKESISSTEKGKQIKITRKNNLTLKEKFDKIDSDILDSIINSLPNRYKDIIRKRENRERLSPKENVTYHVTIMNKVKALLAKEAAYGNISLELLDFYDIKPIDASNVVVKIDAPVTEHSLPSLEKEEFHLNKDVLFRSLEKKRLENEKLYKLRKERLTVVPVDPLEKPSRRVFDLSLKRRYSDIDLEVLEQIISELPEELQKIVENRENRKLTSDEILIYNGRVMPFVKRRIAEEVFLGNIPEEVLLKHGIKPVTYVKRKNQRRVIVADSNSNESNNQILKAKLLTIITDGEVKELDDVERIFYNMFDESYLTDELNPKMFSYIVLRFGYLDGNNYSDNAISKILNDDEIDACKKNIMLYMKYEIETLINTLGKDGYQKAISFNNQ